MAALKDAGFSDAEVLQAAKWLQEKVPVETIIQRLAATKALQGAGSFGGLPTASMSDEAVDIANKTGKWPPWWNGSVSTK